MGLTREARNAGTQPAARPVGRWHGRHCRRRSGPGAGRRRHSRHRDRVAGAALPRSEEPSGTDLAVEEGQADRPWLTRRSRTRTRSSFMRLAAAGWDRRHARTSTPASASRPSSTCRPSSCGSAVFSPARYASICIDRCATSSRTSSATPPTSPSISHRAGAPGRRDAVHPRPVRRLDCRGGARPAVATGHARCADPPVRGRQDPLVVALLDDAGACSPSKMARIHRGQPRSLDRWSCMCRWPTAS